VGIVGIFGRRKKAESGAAAPGTGMVELVLQGGMRVQVPSSGPGFEEMRRQFQEAADAGDANAARYLALLLEAVGRQPADRVGDAEIEAVSDAAAEAYSAGDYPEAVRLLRMLVAAGERRVLPLLGSALGLMGDFDGAEAVLRESAAEGEWRSTYALVGLLQRKPGAVRGTQEQWDLLGRATGQLHNEVRPLVNAGRLEEAEALLRIGADAGDPMAMESLAKVMMQRDGFNIDVALEAHRWLEQAIAAGLRDAEETLEAVVEVIRSQGH
jgi:TPR repeat protein